MWTIFWLYERIAEIVGLMIYQLNCLDEVIHTCAENVPRNFVGRNIVDFWFVSWSCWYWKNVIEVYIFSFFLEIFQSMCQCEKFKTVDVSIENAQKCHLLHKTEWSRLIFR